jgi:alpha-methylacyl-CoA racemase
MLGPLSSVRVIEMVGIGPNTHASMLMANMGADVLRIDRPLAQNHKTELDPLNQLLASRLPSVRLNLKRSEATAAVLELVKVADAIIEGFRPGVMERLGLGPVDTHAVNPGLVYGRMTGWGQSGPMAQSAGHDINYIALSGVLHGLRREGEPPQPPFNFLGDYGGGSLYLVAGVLSGLISARMTGHGVVVDAAMVDGSASLMAQQYAMMASGAWEQPGFNTLRTAIPYYNVYETADDGYIAVGAVEPQFYEAFISGLGLDVEKFPQKCHSAWPDYVTTIASIVRKGSRAEWESRFDGTDACVTPVLSPAEAASHRHIASRGSVADNGGVLHPGPAPRFGPTIESASPIKTDTSAPISRGIDALTAWGLETSVLQGLQGVGALEE